jgi:hypothetical protein
VAAVPKAFILKNVEQVVAALPEERAVGVKGKRRIGRDEVKVRCVRILGADSSHFIGRCGAAVALRERRCCGGSGRHLAGGGVG